MPPAPATPWQPAQLSLKMSSPCVTFPSKAPLGFAFPEPAAAGLAVSLDADLEHPVAPNAASAHTASTDIRPFTNRGVPNVTRSRFFAREPHPPAACDAARFYGEKFSGCDSIATARGAFAAWTARSVPAKMSGTPLAGGCRRTGPRCGNGASAAT